MRRGFPVTEAMRAERRKRAEARNAEYDKLSLQEKLDRLPAEPHAAKQRAKLNALLSKQVAPKLDSDSQKKSTKKVK